jgi:hypothetical protein
MESLNHVKHNSTLGFLRQVHNSDFSYQGDGANPNGVVINAAGSLYGPTGGGTIFKLFKTGSNWILNTLYTFAGGDRGSLPEEVIIGLAPQNETTG